MNQYVYVLIEVKSLECMLYQTLLTRQYHFSGSQKSHPFHEINSAFVCVYVLARPKASSVYQEQVLYNRAHFDIIPLRTDAVQKPRSQAHMARVNLLFPYVLSSLPYGGE